MINELIVNELIEYVLQVEQDEERQEILYNQYEEYIIDKALEIRDKLEYKGGAYYPIDNLFVNIDYIKEFKYFILDQLKTLGVEYYNKELYRIAY